MKKLRRIALIAVVVFVAGWVAIWFVGRSRIEPAVAQEIARLRAQGVTIEYASSSIGGFPFSYEVTYTDVTASDPKTGVTYHLPRIATTASATSPGQLVTHFPAKFQVDLPAPAVTRKAFPGMPETLKVDVEAKDMQLTTTGTPETGPNFSLSAKSVMAITGDKKQPLNLSLVFTGLQAGLSLPRSGQTQGHLIADGIDYAYTALLPQGTYTAVGTADSARVTVSADKGLSALLTREGDSTIAYQTSATQSTLRQLGAKGVEQAITLAAASTAGTIGLNGGVMDLRASSRSNRAMVPPVGSSSTTGPGASIDSVEMQVKGPTTPSDAPEPFTFRLALQHAVADPSIWELFDKKKKLPRDPASLLVDLSGTGRITGAPVLSEATGSAAPPAGGQPVEIDSLSVTSADLSALGASVTATGKLTFQKPDEQPDGTLQVTLTNAMTLPDKLAAAGIINVGQAALAKIMAASWTEPGAKPTERISKIDFSAGGISVNGQPIGK